MDHSMHPAPSDDEIPGHNMAHMDMSSPHPVEHLSGMQHGSLSDLQRRFWISLALTLPILALSPVIQQWLGLAGRFSFSGDRYVLFALASVVFFYGGYPFFKGFTGELKARTPGMMTLIALAISVAYVYSAAVTFGLMGEVFFWELATLIDIMLLGHWIEMRSVMGASRALEEMARLMPAAAHMLMPDGSMMDLPIEKLTKGDRVVVKPGEKIPADGAVVAGESSVNEAMLTGESNPVVKQAGAGVIGGAVNGEGSLTVEVQRTGAQSYLSQVIELVRQAQQSKSRTQLLADRAALWLVILALGSGALTLVLWLSLFGQGAAFAVERMVTVMVITCPHALGLAVPLVAAVSASIAARSGLLIRNRAAFENARNIQAVIFDKTGTLTGGKFGVTDVLSFHKNLPEEDILGYAASVESYSEHPLAVAIGAASKQRLPVTGFKAIPGRGAEGTVSGKHVLIASPGYLEEKGLTVKDARLDKLTSQTKTVVFVVIDNEVAGAVALADLIRPESKKAIARLRDMGIKCMMVTGDNEQVAQRVAAETGLDGYFAGVLPEMKAARIKEVQSRGLTVAMVGDGINDAPALAQADVGIAIGSGTEVAIETADVILVRSNPLDVVTVIKLARATYGKMAQNLVWATGYNLLAIPLAAGVLYSQGILLSPAVGALLMSLSTVIVAVNARLLRLT
jgi:Cu2+-exporting ATPase